MPIATIDLPEGHGPDVKSRLGLAVTEAIARLIDAPPEAIRVILRDKPQEHDFPAGTPHQPAPAQPDGAELVRAYLAAMEARDLPVARALLAPGFIMTFPGGVTMTALEELIAWAAPRYRFVTKSYQRFDALGPVVYCFGTLTGEWPDGTEFQGIRFIDRFELSGGLITRQDVWNDMGEARGQRA